MLLSQRKASSFSKSAVLTTDFRKRYPKDHIYIQFIQFSTGEPHPARKKGIDIGDYPVSKGEFEVKVEILGENMAVLVHRVHDYYFRGYENNIFVYKWKTGIKILVFSLY